MSSSRVEAALEGIASAFGGERLGELLTAVAEARDFTEAAELLLSQVAEAAGAQRSCLLHVRQDGVLALAASAGFEEAPIGEHAIEDLGNPLVVSALSLLPVGCGGGRAGAVTRGPFARWLALPYPRPQERGSLPLLPEARARELLADCQIHEPSLSDGTRRTGHAPGGVLVLDEQLPERAISALARVILLAGPVLSRVAASEEYRRSATRLDQQRDLLTGIVNSLPDPIVITDASNDIIVQNSRAEHLFSFSDTDSEGRRRAVEINNLLFTSFLSRTVIGGATTGGARELNLVDPDEGTDLLFEVLAHPLAAAVSKDGAFVSVLRDVTDLRRAAIELERQVQRGRVAEMDATRERDRLNLILENVGDPILVTDDRSNIILMNRLAEELFQLPDVVADRARLQAVRGNDTRFTTFISDFTLSPANARREQMRLIHPQNARELPVEVVSGKILNERGEPLAIVSVLHDLTKQVENERLYQELKKFSSQLEERIRAATADLAEQNARLQWQSRELEKANRLKSEFLASMSHELRTPINALIGYTALMLDRIYGDLTERQEEGLRRIQVAAQHLLALINDILDLAKIEAGKMPLHLSEVDLTQLAGELNQQIEPLVRKKALDFDLEVPPDAPVMHTDRVKVKQILLNLLSNAVKFTHQGSVRLRVQPLDGRIRFEVIDTGIGIDAKDLESIWEDFRQLDQSRTREYGGTGLGLSITRKLVARLGGSIEVASEMGRGSTFAVTLPVRTLTPEPSTAAEPAIFGARSA